LADARPELQRSDHVRRLNLGPARKLANDSKNRNPWVVLAETEPFYKNEQRVAVRRVNIGANMGRVMHENVPKHFRLKKNEKERR